MILKNQVSSKKKLLSLSHKSYKFKNNTSIPEASPQKRENVPEGLPWTAEKHPLRNDLRRKTETKNMKKFRNKFCKFFNKKFN